MDLLMMILRKVWDIFMSLGFRISYEGTTYYISFFSILLFTTITTLGVILLFKLFD